MQNVSWNICPRAGLVNIAQTRTASPREMFDASRARIRDVLPFIGKRMRATCSAKRGWRFLMRGNAGVVVRVAG